MRIVRMTSTRTLLPFRLVFGSLGPVKPALLGRRKPTFKLASICFTIQYGLGTSYDHESRYLQWMQSLQSFNGENDATMVERKQEEGPSQGRGVS